MYGQKTVLDRQTYLRKVSHWAFERWQKKEAQRSAQNWLDAISQLERQTGRFPTHDQINARAHLLWLIRKDAQSFEDWLDAEMFATQYYEVAIA